MDVFRKNNRRFSLKLNTSLKLFGLKCSIINLPSCFQVSLDGLLKKLYFKPVLCRFEIERCFKIETIEKIIIKNSSFKNVSVLIISIDVSVLLFFNTQLVKTYQMHQLKSIKISLLHIWQFHWALIVDFYECICVLHFLHFQRQ